VGLKSFLYCLVISAVSVVIGLTLANTIRPGERVRPETADRLKARYATAASSTLAAQQAQGRGAESPLMQVVKTVVPANPVFSVATETPQMLQLMFFALIVGVAAALVPRAAVDPLLRALEGVYAVSAKIVDIIMLFAPFAVACLLFNNVARFGIDLLGALSWYVLTVLLG